MTAGPAGRSRVSFRRSPRWMLMEITPKPGFEPAAEAVNEPDNSRTSAKLAIDTTAHRYDLLIVAVLGVLFLGFLAPALGVWEPWEANNAAIAEAMRDSGSWLQVRLPAVGDKFTAIPDLPFNWWPLAASTGLLGTTELGLRLPGLLLSIPLLMLVFATTRRTFGRWAAYFATAGLLCMPLFTFHARFALGSGYAIALIGIATLAFLRLLQHDPPTGKHALLWQGIGWGATAGAALTVGLIGLLTPIIATIAAIAVKREKSESTRWTILLNPMAAIGLAAVGIGWWRASIYMPESANLADLFLWSDLIGSAKTGAGRPSFDAAVHQIGFGLFPLGAFLPLAFADLLWAPKRTDEPPTNSALIAAIGAWCLIAFLGPAIGASYSHVGIFLGAPAAAIAIGIYLARVLRSPPQPLLVVAAVVMLALIDSNLKHETHYLADTLIGGKVDSFPPKLWGWMFARAISVGLLGVLIVYQGGLSWLRAGTRFVFYPSKRRWFDLNAVIQAAALTGVVYFIARHYNIISNLRASKALARLLPNVRQLLIFGVPFLVFYLAVLMFRWWRQSQTQGKDTGEILNLVDLAINLMSRQRYGRRALAVILLVCVSFQTVVVARQLTTNFSQKDLLNHYAELRASADEPLYKYQLSTKNSSFYTQKLDSLTRKTFQEKAAGPDRFFAIVPRSRLATINTEFRNTTKRTLPVLNDDSHRFLLVSNQIADGQTDKNPIKTSLVPDGKLPSGAQKVSINFEDQIELVGWQLDPPQPRPGAPLTLTMFWKATKKITGKWKVFVHIDAPGQRIHADHDPVEGLFPTNNWAVGDVVRDSHHIVVKSSTETGKYTFYAGLFQGNRRMKIKKGPKDNENRARLGTVSVR